MTLNENDTFYIKRTLYASLFISWIIFLAPIPLVNYIAYSLCVCSLVLSIICICLINVKIGLITLFLNAIISPLMYIAGYFIMFYVASEIIEESKPPKFDFSHSSTPFDFQPGITNK